MASEILVLASLISILQLITCQSAYPAGLNANPGYSAISYDGQPEGIITTSPQNYAAQYPGVFNAGNNNAGYSYINNAGLQNVGAFNAGLQNAGAFTAGFQNGGAFNAGLQNGGAFNVISSSPLRPTGISVLSENLAMDGSISVSGSMPFASSVALEGNIQTNGEGNVNYGCGNEARLNDAGSGIGLAGLAGPGQFQNPGFGKPGAPFSTLAANANRLGRS